MNFLTPKKHAGFTLIELLVSIGIIALLTSFIVVGVAETRAKSRDAQRVTDLKQLELALERYYSNNREYPADLVTLVTDGIIEEVPQDPKTNVDYVYQTQETDRNYILTATSDDGLMTCRVSSPRADLTNTSDPECPFQASSN